MAFLEKPGYACKSQVPEPFFKDTQNGDMDHTKPLEGLGGLEMELKGEFCKFASLFPFLFGLILMTSLQRAEPGVDYSSAHASVSQCIRPSPSSGKLKTYGFTSYCCPGE